MASKWTSILVAVEHSVTTGSDIKHVRFKLDIAGKFYRNGDVNFGILSRGDRSRDDGACHSESEPLSAQQIRTVLPPKDLLILLTTAGCPNPWNLPYFLSSIRLRAHLSRCYSWCGPWILLTTVLLGIGRLPLRNLLLQEWGDLTLKSAVKKLHKQKMEMLKLRTVLKQVGAVTTGYNCQSRPLWCQHTFNFPH